MQESFSPPEASGEECCPSVPVASTVLPQIQDDRPFQEVPQGKGLGVVEPRAMRLSQSAQEVAPLTLGGPDTLRLLAWGPLVSPLLALTWNAGSRTWAWGGTGWGQLSDGSGEGHRVQCPECAPGRLHVLLVADRRTRRTKGIPMVPQFQGTVSRATPDASGRQSSLAVWAAPGHQRSPRALLGPTSQLHHTPPPQAHSQQLCWKGTL